MTAPLTKEEELRVLCHVHGLQFKFGEGSDLVSVWTSSGSLLVIFDPTEQALESVRKFGQ